MADLWEPIGIMMIATGLAVVVAFTFLHLATEP